MEICDIATAQRVLLPAIRFQLLLRLHHPLDHLDLLVLLDQWDQQDLSDSPDHQDLDNQEHVVLQDQWDHLELMVSQVCTVTVQIIAY